VRKAVAERFPALPTLVERLAEDLGRTTVAKALKVGDRAPDFVLRRADTDESVRLADQLKQGPVVVSFYRGQW
jgi:hypothetical protein